MNIILFPKMAFSPTAAWADLHRAPPSRGRFLQLLAPFALLPPVMLFLAGTLRGDSYAHGPGAPSWGLLATLLLALEVLTLAVMARLVRSIAETCRARLGADEALLLTGVSAIPLFLSSLALAAPGAGFGLAVLLAALCLSCVIFYHGLDVLGHPPEKLYAAHCTYTVAGAGTAWACLVLWLVLLIY